MPVHVFAGCEDIIADSLGAENLVSTLVWSEEAHGSPWVHRQALHYLREEFTTICHSPLLYDLSKHYLMQAIKSEFLQVSSLNSHSPTRLLSNIHFIFAYNFA